MMDAIYRTPAEPDAPGGMPAVPHAQIVVRPLAYLAEFEACVALQDAVWGKDFSERVPVSLLKVATYIGGIVAGAFRQGELVGIVFGLTGSHEGRVVHWSHMLAVHEHARNLGAGRMLKEYQRAELARRGIPEMIWTFDPLQSKNAYLNLNILGARVVRYAPNMYGTTDSPLHHGLATDRLVVAAETGARPTAGARVPDAGAPMLTMAPRDGDVLLDRSSARPPRIRIEIPMNIEDVMERSPKEAAAWHAAVRENFLWAFQNGYEANGFVRDIESSRSFYTLESRAVRA